MMTTPKVLRPSEVVVQSSTKARPASHRTHSRRAMIIGTLIIVALATYFFFPIYWQIVASTKSSNQLTSTSGMWFTSPSKWVENLQGLFSADGGIFSRWFLNSLFYAGVGGIVATVISGAGGYALALLRFRGSRAASLVIIIGVMVPGTVLAFPLFLVMARLGLVDTYWAVLLPSLVSPFAVFLARMFASQSIPVDLLEAARIDGAGELRIALTIGSRLMLPGLVTILLIQIVAIWNNFFLPLLVLNSAETFPATVGLYVWNGRVTQSPGYQSFVIMGSIISSIPLVVLFLTLQRYWRSGIATGAVKA